MKVEIVKEMLLQRGEVIVDEDSERMLTENLVFFLKSVPKLNLSSLQIFVAQCDALNRKHCIITYSSRVTSRAVSMVQRFMDIGNDIELFHVSELAINPTKHEYSPVYMVLSAQDATDHRLKYGGRLPFMLSSEMVARFLHLKSGQIVRVIRIDGDIAYRVVCNDPLAKCFATAIEGASKTKNTTSVSIKKKEEGSVVAPPTTRKPRAKKQVVVVT